MFLHDGEGADGAAQLVKGQAFTITTREVPGDGQVAGTTYAGLPGDVHAGDPILIDDGKVRLRVTAVEPGKIAAVVEVGGKVSDSKGVNVPDVLVPIPALTDKDRADLIFALEQRADWIALSFVQRPEDVAEARALIGDKASLLAKIEKPAAIDQLDDIVALADAVMVARGDLGVELPPEQVPPLQNWHAGAEQVPGTAPTGDDLAHVAEVYARDLALFEELSGIDTSAWPTRLILDGQLDPGELAARLARKVR